MIAVPTVASEGPVGDAGRARRLVYISNDPARLAAVPHSGSRSRRW